MLERRFVEQRFDVIASRLAGQRLVQQAWRVGALGIDRFAGGGRRVGPGVARQLRQQQRATQQHGIGAAGQALAQAAEGQFDVPGFQCRAAIEVEGETTGHVHRLPDDQQQDIEQVGEVFEPQPLTAAGGDDAFPAPVQLHLLRQHHVEQHDQPHPQGKLQVHADQGQPGGRGAVALAKNHQTLAARLAGQPFELQHRQVEAARRAQPAPGQAGQQLRSQQSGQGAQGLFQRGGITEQGVREDV